LRFDIPLSLLSKNVTFENLEKEPEKCTTGPRSWGDAHDEEPESEFYPSQNVKEQVL
jgi:hypothetical protein